MRTVLQTMEQTAQRVHSKIAGFAERSGKAQKRAVDDVARAQERANGSPYRSSGRQPEMQVTASKKQFDAHVKAFEKHEKDKTTIAKREQSIRDRIRDATFSKDQRDGDRAMRQGFVVGQQNRRSIVSGARDMGRSVVGTMGMGARAVMGGVGEIARGAGMDTSLGGLTAKVMSTEDATRRATLSGMAAKGRVASGADVDTTMTSVRSAADATATSYSEMAVALENFVAKSSDLEGGKRSMEDLAKVAKASGVDLGELALGAGAISQSMSGYGDSAEEAARKSKDLMGMVRLLAKQGSMGSVEIKDLATYMPRLSASAGKFTGDYGTNLGQLGAVAQMAMKGGRSTAAEATNSAQALARDLTKKSNLKYLSGAGINPFADEGRTKLRSVSDIVTAVYAKTKGDQAQISALFRNEMSRSAINAFSGVYGDAGGGEAGLKAIQDTFKNFSKTFSAVEVNQAAGLAIDSKAGKAQAMQNRFETAWSGALEKITPALEKMAPNIGKVADKFADLVAWLATNPGEAIRLALMASIAKAGIGAAVSGALTRYVTGAAGGVPGAPGGGGGGKGIGGGLGVGGNLLAGLTIAATAISIVGVGMVAIDTATALMTEKEDAKREKLNQTSVDAANLITSTDEATRKEAQSNLEKRKAEIDASLDQASEIDQMPDQFRATSGALNWITAGAAGTSFDKQDAVRGAHEDRDALREEKAQIEERLTQFKSRSMADAFGTDLVTAGKPTGEFGGPGLSLIGASNTYGSKSSEVTKGEADIVTALAEGRKTDAAGLQAALAGALANGVRVTNLHEIKVAPTTTGDGA